LPGTFTGESPMAKLIQKTQTQLLLILLGLALSACPNGGTEVEPAKVDEGGHLILPNNIPDGGINWNEINNDGDGGVEDASDGFDGGLSSGTVFIENLSPATGALAGGYRVRLNGYGFAPDMAILFGGVAADQVLFLNTRAITCRVPPGTAPGPVTVKVELEDDWAVLPGGFTYFSPVNIESIAPASGSTQGGTTVTLTGEGFHEEMMVLVGDRQAANLVINDNTEATIVTPPGPQGRVDVTALDSFGESTLGLGFTYVNDLSVTELNPSWNNVGDTSLITLTGTGFTQSLTASLDDVALTLTTFIDDEHVVLSYTSDAAGTKDLSIDNGFDSQTVENAFVVFDEATDTDLALSTVFPNSGSLEGGTSVTLTGNQLDNVTTVTFGSSTLTGGNLEIIDSHQIRITVPAASAAGSVDVTVASDTSSAVLSNAYTYLAGPKIISLSPSYGPQEGGTEVTVNGENFTDTMAVALGGAPIADFTLNSASSVTFTTPPGAPGYVDLEVSENGLPHLYPGAFYYESELSVTSIQPVRGGMSGNTHVSIYGQGFQGLSSFEVKFGGYIATEVEVISDNLIYARTPMHEPGVVDVEILGPQEQTVTLEDSFTYFDPTFMVGGTRGGPVDGAVYVTALDAMFGYPIEGLTAWLGTTGGNQYVATTNALGQATLSGPDIQGPQTVTVGGECWENATVVDVNASEVTVYLQYICSSPPSSGGGGGGIPPATISGHVTGFAKEFFDPAALGTNEIALAVVITTAADEFSGTPDPGTANVVFEDGGLYFIASSRVGRLAVVALAGVYNLETNDFDLKQMGVRRNVHPEFGVDLVDQDIELTIPLNQTIDFSLPDAPLGPTAGGCTITRVIPFLRFGGEGAFSYASGVSTTQNLTIDKMPDVPGEMLSFVAGTYTTDKDGLLTEEGTAITTEGSTIVSGVGTDWDMTDFFGFPLVVGRIIVIEKPGGGGFAGTIVEAISATSVRLSAPVDFSGSNLKYHIGSPDMPKSEIVQDGNGSLLGGVTIQPVMGFPEPISPSPQGVMHDRMLRWKAPPGQQPTFHRMYIYGFNQGLWSFYVEGSRTKVPLPFIPDTVNLIEYGEGSGPPHDVFLGGYIWQHIAIYSPEVEFSNFSYLDIGSAGRRSWSTQKTNFVVSSENPDTP